jgi:gas vesicle protein
MSDNGGNGTGMAMMTFMVGAVVGGAIALLYAPQSGVATRKLLRSKKDDFIDLLEKKKHLIEKMVVEGEEKVRDGLRRELAKLDDVLADLL